MVEPTAAAPDAGQFQRILARNVMVPLVAGLVSAALFVAIILYLLSALRLVEHTERVMTRANEIARLAAEQEASMRGFALTGDERFLEPFDVALPRIRTDFQSLAAVVADNPAQTERAKRIEAMHAEWLRFAQETIAQRRLGQNYMERITGGQGKRLSDAFRDEVQAFVEVERRQLLQRNETADFNSAALTIAYIVASLLITAFLAYFGRRELTGLSRQFGAALEQQQLHSANLQAQAWVREGQTQLGQALSGRKDLAATGRGALEFLARYLGAGVGAFYVAGDGESVRRVAAYGFTPEHEEADQVFAPAESLVSEVAASGRPMQLLSLIHI